MKVNWQEQSEKIRERAFAMVSEPFAKQAHALKKHGHTVMTNKNLNKNHHSMLIRKGNLTWTSIILDIVTYLIVWTPSNMNWLNVFQWSLEFMCIHPSKHEQFGKRVKFQYQIGVSAARVDMLSCLLAMTMTLKHLNLPIHGVKIGVIMDSDTCLTIMSWTKMRQQRDLIFILTICGALNELAKKVGEVIMFFIKRLQFCWEMAYYGIWWQW